MSILIIILLSCLFAIFFISIHLLFLYIFSLKKIIQILLPFILSNLILVYFTINTELYKFFTNSFVINISILIIYMQFLSVMKRGFTLSIITIFKKKEKFNYKELVKNYGGGKGAKWILADRLNAINKLKIIKLNKKIKLNKLGHFLSIILIFLRKILAIKDFG